jgi:hypothetical protein
MVGWCCTCRLRSSVCADGLDDSCRLCVMPLLAWHLCAYRALGMARDLSQVMLCAAGSQLLTCIVSHSGCW